MNGEGARQPVQLVGRQPIFRTPTRIGQRLRLGLSAGIAALVGLLPHIVHHAGPLAGAALFAGVGGSLLFGALGLVLAIPFLVRLRRRFGNWRAPALALLLFAFVFSLSAFVVGPQIGGDGDQERPAQSPASIGSGEGQNESGHDAHH